MYHHAHTIARNARFNNCPVVTVHKDYNLKGQLQWDVFIGTDEHGDFKEATAPTRAEAVEIAKDVAKVSGGFVTDVMVQHGRNFRHVTV